MSGLCVRVCEWVRVYTKKCQKYILNFKIKFINLEGTNREETIKQQLQQ